MKNTHICRYNTLFTFYPPSERSINNLIECFSREPEQAPPIAKSVFLHKRVGNSIYFSVPSRTRAKGIGKRIRFPFQKKMFSPYRDWRMLWFSKLNMRDQVQSRTRPGDTALRFPLRFCDVGALSANHARRRYQLAYCKQSSHAVEISL